MSRMKFEGRATSFSGEAMLTGVPSLAINSSIAVGC
jgi:hypothetical protein